MVSSAFLRISFGSILALFFVFCIPLKALAESTSFTQSFNQEHLAASLTEDRKIIFGADDATGAFNYSFPIVVPPGRNGLQPDVKLNYSNQQAGNFSNLIGYGWNINIPYIERMNKEGTNKLYLYSEKYFNSSLSGELVLVSGTTYAPKVENGDFLNYTYSGGYWTVKDKKGTVYKFGQNVSARQDENDPSTPATIYKWMLEEVRDTNDNYIKYEYYKDAGQIYPSKIKYTGSGATDGIFEIEFLRETRNDIAQSYATAFSVTTNYRISEIQTKINGSWVRKYTLTYVNGDNGKRSLLKTITESGKDEVGIITTLEPTTFHYEVSTPGWTINNNWQAPVETYFEMGVDIFDANGDAIPDLVQSMAVNGPDVMRTYVGNGLNTWTLSSSFIPPVAFYGSDNMPYDKGVRSADIDGDGLTDLTRSWGGGPSDGLYRNLGTGWTATPNQSWDPPPFVTNNSTDTGARITEINGDGLADILLCSSGWSEFYLNNGNGWTQSQYPIDNCPPVNFTTGSYIVDVNNDGLADIVRSEDMGGNQNVRQTYLNKGDKTWETINYLTPPLPMLFYLNNQSPSDKGVRLFDVNGDGLVDMVKNVEGPGAPVTQTYLNNGTDWVLSTPWSNWCAPFAYEAALNDTATRVTDVNGDGMPDTIQVTNTGSGGTKVCINNSKPVDVLKKITFPAGGTTTVTYKSSAQYKDPNNNPLNPDLPFILQTVSDIVTTDPVNGVSNTKQYSYEGGLYYFNTPFDRKFAGFAKVTEISANKKVTSYFHQGNITNSIQGEFDDHVSKIGEIYRTEVTDSSGNIYSKTINKWDRYNQGAGRDFVKLARSTSEAFDGNATHKDTAEEYTYDNTYGNITQKISWGEVSGADDGSFTDVGADKFTENILYVANTGNYVVGMPYQDTVLNQSADKIRESRMYYDNLALGSVGAGNETKIEKWKVGTTYVNTQKTYNATYGIVTSATDERGKVTNYAYDSSNLYPATVMNPLSQITQYLYDYSAGKPKQVTDVNNFIYQTVFDGLDRVLQEKAPDLVSPYTPILKTQYAYIDTPLSVAAQRTDYLDGANSVDTYQYFDGLNRLIQERREAENAGEFNARDIVYNNRGLVLKDSLNYTSAGSAKTSQTATATLYNNYTYDAVGRVLTVSNNAGVTVNVYDDWQTSITDPNGDTKHYWNDGYGNLAKVEEINSGNTYTTLYEWNGNKNLTKITDALSNIRNFTYDGLGRKLTAQDLHATGDVTFGTWTYAYDNTGNLTQTLDPKSQTVNYTYNDINQALTEDYTGGAGTEAMYTYSGCANGIGKLCSVMMSSGVNTNYAYNSNGAVASEAKIIDAVTYTTTNTYDRQGNTTNISSPDNSEVKYTFNTAGLLNKIERKETGEAFTDVVTNFDYNPMNQVSTEVLPNTVTTTNTYDATKLYRLTRKLTQNTVPTKLQDLNYIYDANGNITKIIDASNTNSSKTVDYVYDDLNRLLTATATNVASGQSAYTHTFSYNAVGNITNKSDMGAYTYAGTNYANPHAPTSINGVTHTYDNNGNLTSAGSWTHTYDYKNRITQSSNGASTTYAYDHTGQRVKKTSGGITTIYPNKYFDTTGTKNTRYIFTPNSELVATITTETSGTSGDIGFKTAGVISSSTGWANFTTTRLATSDNSKSSCDRTCDNNDNGQVSSFTFSVPTGATINGIEVVAEMAERASFGNIPAYFSLSWNNGTNFTATKTATVDGTADANYTLGGATDTWGRTWTDTELSNPSFRLKIDKASNSDTLYVDQIKVKVYYTVAGNPTTTTNYIHTDHLASAEKSTDMNGNVVQVLDYYPYGSKRVDEGTDVSQREFIGQYYDNETTLNYLNARYYEGKRGQFLSQDPVFWEIGQTKDGKNILTNPQAMNSYSYANNNPIGNSDPTGRSLYIINASVAFVSSLAWNRGRDIAANFTDWKSDNLPWYSLLQARGDDAAFRYIKDAVKAMAVAVATAGADKYLGGKAVTWALTKAEAKILSATAGAVPKVGISILSGGLRDPETGKIDTSAVVADSAKNVFDSLVFGNLIGHLLSTPAGRPPTTIAGSIAGSRAVNEHIRSLIGTLIQFAGDHITSPKTK